MPGSNFEVATSRTARDINRRIILNLVRKHQPISRAELSRFSRLQRSTVSAIIDQLIAERWVTTGAFGDLPRGRKPAFIHLNGGRAGIVGVDVEPTETNIAVADLEMRFLTQEPMPTNCDAKQFVARLGERLVRLIRSHPHIPFEGIGVTLPGRIELLSNRLAFAPNLEWKPIDLKKLIEQMTGLRVELENAANACALAEVLGGYHQENFRNLIVVTVSEGIGTGMIFNGQLVRGNDGMAGEFGHVMIQENGPLCQCGNRGCFEMLASNTAAVRYFKESMAGRHGVKYGGELSFDSVLKMAERNNRHACAALDRMAQALGDGLSMIITGLAPDVIVVVGEVTRAWIRVGPIIAGVVKRRLPTGAATRILPGTAGAHPRLRGAIALVLQRYFGTVQRPSSA
jgi:predicted NBD/HSP70 family sugar kinase